MDACAAISADGISQTNLFWKVLVKFLFPLLKRSPAAWTDSTAPASHWIHLTDGVFARIYSAAHILEPLGHGVSPSMSVLQEVVLLFLEGSAFAAKTAVELWSTSNPTLACVKMFCEKALKLIKELDRSQESLPPFDDDGIRQVLEEMRGLYDQNVAAANESTTDPDRTAISGITIRHAALERNKRCLMAYIYNRIQKTRQMRWEFGSILPPEIKSNLCELEVQWFNGYSKCLATYMRSIGGQGLNLAQDVKPPKSLYVEVRSLTDYGKFELDNGEVVLLKKHSTHLMSRAQCEPLIIQGVLEQISC